MQMDGQTEFASYNINIQSWTFDLTARVWLKKNYTLIFFCQGYIIKWSTFYDSLRRRSISIFRILIGLNISVLGILSLRFWNRLIFTKQIITISMLVSYHNSFWKVIPYQAGFFGQYFVKSISIMFKNVEIMPWNHSAYKTW